MMLNYRTLDAVLVVGSMVMLGGVFYALVFYTIPQANLPILSGLVGSTVGTMLGLYAGARWGNKKTDEPHPAPAGGDVSLSLTATAPSVDPSVTAP